MSLNISSPDDTSVGGYGADSAKLEQLLRARKEQESLPLALLGGAVAAFVAALLWGTITYATGYQIGFMAIGVGFLVGYAVNYLGKGMSQTYSIIGAVFALLGCVLGNLFAAMISAALVEGIPVLGILITLVTTPSILVEILVATFSPIDILFYGIAIYEGYKLSPRLLTEEELQSVQKTPPPAPAPEPVQP
jgi:hypothetical protein